MKKNLRIYYAAGAAAFLIWGFIPFPIRAMGGHPSEQILFYRLFFAWASLLLVTGLFRRQAVRETFRLFWSAGQWEQYRVMWLAVLGGLLLTVNWLAFIYVMNHISVQTASFSYLVCPILTAVLAVALLKERLKSHQWFAIGISTVSCCLVGVESWVNLLYSFLVAASYALYLITQRLTKQYDRLVMLVVQMGVAFAIVGPLYSWSAAAAPLPDAHFYFQAALLGVLFTVVPLFLNLYALNELKSSTIGVLMYINPVLNFGLAFWYYGEPVSQPQVVAYALIVLALVLYQVSPTKLPLRTKAAG